MVIVYVVTNHKWINFISFIEFEKDLINVTGLIKDKVSL